MLGLRPVRNDQFNHNYISRDLFSQEYVHYSKKLKEHFDIMIFIERYPLTLSGRYATLMAHVHVRSVYGRRATLIAR